MVEEDVEVGSHWVGTKRQSMDVTRWVRWYDTRTKQTTEEVPKEVVDELEKECQRRPRTVKDWAGIVASLLFFGLTYTSYVVQVCGDYYAGVPDGDMSSEPSHWPLKAALFGGIMTFLYVMCVWSFIQTATTGPGFISRKYKADHPLISENEMYDLPQCVPCNTFKPLRVHHCGKCGVCVLRYDHHCPWVGQCIGFHNHKVYYVLIWYVFVSCVAWIGTAAPVVQEEHQGTWGSDKPKWYVVTFILSFSLVCTISFGVGVLVLQHTVFISRNLTDVEYRKHETHYDLGSRLKNFRAFCGVGSILCFPFPCSSSYTHTGTEYIKVGNLFNSISRLSRQQDAPPITPLTRTDGATSEV